MLMEPIPLDIFIRDAFERKEIKTITDEWRVDVDQIKFIIKESFQDMGLYQVHPTWIPFLLKAVGHFLQNSVAIKKLVKEAARREAVLAKVKRSFAD